MGCYVDPPDMQKEDWLQKNAREFVQVEGAKAACGAEDKIVILFDNGPFTAAAVAFNERELEAFTRPTDDRPKRFFTVAIDALKTVVNPNQLHYLE